MRTKNILIGHSYLNELLLMIHDLLHISFFSDDSPDNLQPCMMKNCNAARRKRDVGDIILSKSYEIYS